MAVSKVRKKRKERVRDLGEKGLRKGSGISSRGHIYIKGRSKGE